MQKMKVIEDSSMKMRVSEILERKLKFIESLLKILKIPILQQGSVTKHLENLPRSKQSLHPISLIRSTVSLLNAYAASS